MIKVKEGEGHVKPPKLLLNRTSPCCINISAELVDGTAKGELCNVCKYVNMHRKFSVTGFVNRVLKAFYVYFKKCILHM